MFIDLTDHLRCTESHEEHYVVLLTSSLSGRSVRTGSLGCPVCHRIVTIAHGVADFGGGVPSDTPTALTAEAVSAFLGLGGPGGVVALAGSATTLAPALVEAMPGVSFALINPPAGVADRAEASVLRSGVWPLKSGSMRGVVLGADAAADAGWVTAAAASVLPGLRVVGEGAVPDLPGLELMASADGVWVGKRG